MDVIHWVIHFFTSHNASFLLIIIPLLLLWFISKNPKAMVPIIVAVFMIWGGVAGAMWAKTEVDRRIAAGEKGWAQLVATVEEFFIDEIIGWLLPGKAGKVAIETGMNLSENQKELALAEKICLEAPFVKAMGNPVYITYCQRQDSNVDLSKTFSTPVNAVKQAVKRSHPTKLNTRRYLNCLESAAKQITPEYPYCLQYKTVQEQRLCLELAIQVPHDQGDSYYRLAQAIEDCRTA